MRLLPRTVRSELSRQFCVGVFLDNILPESVYDSLKKHDTDHDMAEWYLDYLKHRNMFFTLDGSVIARTIGRGFPQGGVASAKFWLLAFDGAVEIINSQDIKGTALADDCSGLYGGRSISHLLRNVQRMLNRLTEWGRERGLEFNPTKTEEVMFSRRAKEPPFKLEIDGTEVEYSDSVKYLRVVLERKLVWQALIENKIGKAKRLLNLLCKQTESIYGPSLRLTVWIYTGIVRPSLT